jgi:Uma2 family endonuclease
MPAPRLTTDEYFRTAETLLPQELVWGVVRDAAAAPTPGHQWAVGRFFLALEDHISRTNCGRVWISPIDVVLDQSNHLVVQPDLIVIAKPRLGIVTDRGWGPPDLVVEILSPRSRIGTLEERVAWFVEYGVRECWLVHLLVEEVEVLELASGGVERRRSFREDEPMRSAVLPDFTRTPASIFDGASSR